MEILGRANLRSLLGGDTTTVVDVIDVAELPSGSVPVHVFPTTREDRTDDDGPPRFIKVYRLAGGTGHVATDELRKAIPTVQDALLAGLVEILVRDGVAEAERVAAELMSFAQQLGSEMREPREAKIVEWRGTVTSR